jgi:hypothetical protein
MAAEAASEVVLIPAIFTQSRIFHFVFVRFLTAYSVGGSSEAHAELNRNLRWWASLAFVQGYLFPLGRAQRKSVRLSLVFKIGLTRAVSIVPAISASNRANNRGQERKKNHHGDDLVDTLINVRDE